MVWRLICLLGLYCCVLFIFDLLLVLFAYSGFKVGFAGYDAYILVDLLVSCCLDFVLQICRLWDL